MRTDVTLLALACASLLLAGMVLAHTGHIIAHRIGCGARNRTVGGLL
jgi:hypothetical protein